MGVSIHDFEDWRAQQTSFEDIAAYFAETVNVGGTEGGPSAISGPTPALTCSTILRVQPILGRTFRPEEDHPSTPPVMILSYRAWQDRFQGDPGVIGRTVAGQCRDDHHRRRHAGEVRLPWPDGRVAAAAHRRAGLQARRGTGRRGHAAAGGRPAEGRRHARDRAGRDVGHCRQARHRLIPSRTPASASRPCGRSTCSLVHRRSPCSTRCSALCSACC